MKHICFEKMLTESELKIKLRSPNSAPLLISELGKWLNKAFCTPGEGGGQGSRFGRDQGDRADGEGGYRGRGGGGSGGGYDRGSSGGYDRGSGGGFDRGSGYDRGGRGGPPGMG